MLLFVLDIRLFGRYLDGRFDQWLGGADRRSVKISTVPPPIRIEVGCFPVEIGVGAADFGCCADQGAVDCGAGAGAGVGAGEQ